MEGRGKEEEDEGEGKEERRMRERDELEKEEKERRVPPTHTSQSCLCFSQLPAREGSTYILLDFTHQALCH